MEGYFGPVLRLGLPAALRASQPSISKNQSEKKIISNGPAQRSALRASRALFGKPFRAEACFPVSETDEIEQNEVTFFVGASHTRVSVETVLLRIYSYP